MNRTLFPYPQRSGSSLTPFLPSLATLHITHDAYANKLAPPLSTASISASVHRTRWKRAGSSFRSHTSPLPSLIGPSSCAECPPMAPYGLEVCAAAAADEEEEEGAFCCWPPRGPCWVARLRYEANDSGSV
jgi:hypothetical protein